MQLTVTIALTIVIITVAMADTIVPMIPPMVETTTPCEGMVDEN